MKKLAKLALENKRHLILLFFTIIFSWFMQISAMMEMYSMGLLTNNGPDFFALFSPRRTIEKQIEQNPSTVQEKLTQKKEVLRKQVRANRSVSDKISLQDVQNKWPEIDKEQKGFITKEDASDYMHRTHGRNVLTKLMILGKDKFNLSNNVILLLVILALVGLFKVTCTFLSRYFSTLVGIRISKALREKYFDHLQTLPMSFFQKHNIGSLSVRVSGDAGVVSGAIIAILTNYIQVPFVIGSCLFGLFMISVELSLVIFVGLPLMALPIYYLARKSKKSQRKMQGLAETFAQLLVDYLAGIQTIKLFNMEKFAGKKYVETNDKMTVIEQKMSLYSYIAKPILHMMGTFFLACILIYGLYYVKMHVSDLVVYVGLLHLFYDPIKKFGEENVNIQKGLVAAERMFSVLEIQPDIKDKPNAHDFEDFKDEIKFENIWFKYEDQWVLKDLSFTVKKGETVALVGPTGAGKSTIVQLLPRLYDVNKGRILIDGIPVTDYKQKSIREKISTVMQKPFLFYDTIENNICYGRNFSHEEVYQAAKRAHADEFIQCLPQKYSTLLAEMGKSLSGGQQQRLAIARALVKKAPILIMDEATSSLDSISENKIKQAITSLKGEITQIIIAHRLSTIEDADKIIYMEHGSIIAEGPRDELYQNCIGFRNMWDMMFRKEQTETKEVALATTE